MSMDARARHLRASNEHDAWDELPRITAPTLILHGTDDQLTPVANAHLLADRIPESSVHEFVGMRHAFFEEACPEASDVVLQFLKA